MQDGSDEMDKFDMERKSCDPGQAQALETWHESTQCSRATQHHRIWLFLECDLSLIVSFENFNEIARWHQENNQHSWNVAFKPQTHNNY